LTRILWRANDLTRVPKDEPFLLTLIKYRLREDRQEVIREQDANLVSSRTWDGRHLPIIDLDLAHEYVPSNTPGHAHLYLNEEISTWRWCVLMIGLRAGKVLDKGAFVWGIRRGANFARLPGVPKDLEGEVKSSYGWIFRKRGSRAR